MAKFYGDIGFSTQEQTKPGVWANVITLRKYFGDVITNSRRSQSSNQLNDNIVISNEISIIADPYANENFHSIVYVEFMGTKWKVSNVSVQYPRLTLTLGDVYNG
nr:MAG TPA: hypothetical protein [Bacteriophage sp.]